MGDVEALAEDREWFRQAVDRKGREAAREDVPRDALAVLTDELTNVPTQGGQPRVMFLPSQAAEAILASPWLAAHVAAARADGVNEGIRLAADMIRGHVFAPNAVDIARFLDERADRLRPREGA